MTGKSGRNSNACNQDSDGDRRNGGFGCCGCRWDRVRRTCADTGADSLVLLTLPTRPALNEVLTVRSAFRPVPISMSPGHVWITAPSCMQVRIALAPRVQTDSWLSASGLPGGHDVE